MHTIAWKEHILLTHLRPMSHFRTLWKSQKTYGFQGVQKCDIGLKCVNKDSMAEGIDERRISSKRVVKVRKFLEAIISDIYHCLIPLLEKKTWSRSTSYWWKLWRNRNCRWITPAKIIYSRKTPHDQCYTFKVDNKS